MWDPGSVTEEKCGDRHTAIRSKGSYGPRSPDKRLHGARMQRHLPAVYLRHVACSYDYSDADTRAQHSTSTIIRPALSGKATCCISVFLRSP